MKSFLFIIILFIIPLFKIYSQSSVDFILNDYLSLDCSTDEALVKARFQEVANLGDTIISELSEIIRNGLSERDSIGLSYPAQIKFRRLQKFINDYAEEIGVNNKLAGNVKRLSEEEYISRSIFIETIKRQENAIVALKTIDTQKAKEELQRLLKSNEVSGALKEVIIGSDN